MTYLEKLKAVRAQMQNDGVDAYVIPSADPHISEYLPDYYKSITFITGFTGSVSTVVITKDFAGLWADSRYFEQATDQLQGSGFELVKLKAQGVAEYVSWLENQLSEGDTVAFDEKTVAIFVGEYFEKTLAKKNIQFVDKDYLNATWEGRPALPENAAYLIDYKYTGQSTAEKLKAVRMAMQKADANYHLISSLDDLAWLFNIRGTDINFNPVVLAFALITANEATFYLKLTKLSDADKATLKSDGVQLANYDAVAGDLQQLKAGSSILIDPKRNCYAFYKMIPASLNKISATNPSTILKAIKNEVEIASTRKTMVKDGVAITKFFKWIKDNVRKFEITEISAAERLRQFRAEQDGFVGESFNTIAGYRAHGALPHYAATVESDVAIKPQGLFLVDSGGQYNYGTTDITRVIPLGQNTDEEKADYTLVLKGMIEGSRMQFPKGTCGYQIDAVTRRPLWEHSINYGHGTGHGVGFFLNVHEGPHVFNASALPVAIELGTITSIEPGIYRIGKHGIRIENLVLTISHCENEFNTFYSFETLTIAPIDTTIVQKDLLEQPQIDWLNNYHENVYETLSPFLTDDEQLFLKEMTKAI